MIRKYSIPLTTNSSGAVTAYSGYISGYILAVQYVKTDFADGVDFTITADEAGESILSLTDQNSATIVRPRAATHSTAGVAAVYAAAGTAVNDHIAIARDRVKVVIAQGGNTKSGTIKVTVDDGR